MVATAFISGFVIVLSVILYETYLARSGYKLQNIVRLGVLRASPAMMGVCLGYAAALLSGGLDELWHRIFGIDATLWSPPHLCIMASTLFVDFNLLIGIANSARRLGMKFEWRSPLLWGVALIGAYTFESVNFQMSEGFIAGYRAQGLGITGLLFPILVGALFPLPLLLSIKLARRFWVAALIFALAIILQYIGTGVAAAGFAIFKPVSVIEEFVRLNPQSTAAKTREFAHLIGFNGLIGFMQAWALQLSALPLILVSLLEFSSRARRHPLLAAPLYSASLVIVSYLWFSLIPGLRDYPITWAQVALGAALSASAGLVTGWLGLWLAKRLSSYEHNLDPQFRDIQADARR